MGTTQEKVSNSLTLRQFIITEYLSPLVMKMYLKTDHVRLFNNHYTFITQPIDGQDHRSHNAAGEG